MIRNILYSLFSHFIIGAIVFLSLNKVDYFKQEINPSQNQKVAVNFIKKDQIYDPTLFKKPNKTSRTINKSLIDSQKMLKSIRKSQDKIKEVAKNIKIKPKPILKPKIDNLAQKPTKEVIKEVTETKKYHQKEPEKIDKNPTKDFIEEEITQDLSDQIDDEEQLNEYYDLENIDLSNREKFNIALQIKRCYNKSIKDSKNKPKTDVIAFIELEKDGTIFIDKAIIFDIKKYNDPSQVDFRNAVDNVRAALLFCSPIRNINPKKYHIWKKIELNFEKQ